MQVLHVYAAIYLFGTPVHSIVVNLLRHLHDKQNKYTIVNTCSAPWPIYCTVTHYMFFKRDERTVCQTFAIHFELYMFRILPSCYRTCDTLYLSGTPFYNPVCHISVVNTHFPPPKKSIGWLQYLSGTLA